MYKTNLCNVIKCLIHKGDVKYLHDEGKSCKCACCRGIWFWTILIMSVVSILFVGISIVMGLNRTDNPTATQDYASIGMTVITILTAAATMMFSIFISNPLFTPESKKEKNELISLTALIIIYQLCLTVICFLDILFSFGNILSLDPECFSIGLQIFSVIFMVISDIHLILHITTIFITKPEK